jgi:hypothetical protein
MRIIHKLKPLGQQPWYYKLVVFTIINLFLFIVTTSLLSSDPHLIEIKKVSIVNKTKDSITVEFHSIIKNSNYFPISASQIQFQAVNDGDTVGNGELETLALGSFTKDTVKLKITFSVKKLALLIMPPFSDSFKFTVLMKGSFSPLFFYNEYAFDVSISPSNVKKLILNALDPTDKETSIRYEKPTSSNLYSGVNCLPLKCLNTKLPKTTTILFQAKKYGSTCC